MIEVPATAWFRTHRASPVLSGGIAFAALSVIVLREIGREARDDALSLGGLLFFAAALLVISCVTVGVSFVLWHRKWFALDDEYVHSRFGGLEKSATHTLLSSVESVDVERNFQAKLFGFAKLRVCVADGENLEIGYLRLADALEMRDQILDGTRSVSPVVALAVPESCDDGLGCDVGAPMIVDDSAGASVGSPVASREFDAVVYSLPRERGVKADLLLRLPFGIFVAVLLLVGVVGVVVLAPDALTSQFDGRSTVSAVLVVLVPLFLGFFGLVKLLTRFFGSQVRYEGGTLELKRGLVSEYSSSMRVDRAHWVELSQPFMWRGRNWWRLRLRLLSLDGLEEIEDADNASAKEILLPVATVDELREVLTLFSGVIGANVESVLQLAQRRLPLDVVTGRRARVFDPIVHGHEGFTLSDGNLVRRTGRFSTKLIVVPLLKVQEVELTQGPLQRAASIGSVQVFGAGEVGECVVDNLDIEHARVLFTSVKEQMRTGPLVGTRR